MKHINLSKKDDKFLSDKKLKEEIPLFVDKDTPSDHKCSSCKFRIIGKDSGLCSIVEGPISFSNGTCGYWAEGKSAEHPSTSRMHKDTAGYAESDGPINCGSCRHFKKEDANTGLCTLWNGKALVGQCCIAWEK